VYKDEFFAHLGKIMLLKSSVGYTDFSENWKNVVVRTVGIAQKSDQM